MVGDAERAVQLHHEVLSIRERVSGTEHPATRSPKATWHAGTISGNFTAARDIFADLLEIRVRIFGDGNYRTLLVRENLAEWTSRSGDAAGARARYTELLAIQERALGADHPSTLKARELTGLLDRRCGIGQDALAIGSARRSDYAAGNSRLAWNAPLLLVGSRY